MTAAGRIVITGGAGFIGVNAAERFIRAGWQVTVIDNLSRRGSKRNLEYLEQAHQGEFVMLQTDLRQDSVELRQAVAGSDVVLHLAAQVAVTTSVANPREDFEINALGTLNVLEAARQATAKPLVLYASTNKVYGGMEDVAIAEDEQRYRYANLADGVPEERPLDFHSPYGCSKGAADQYVRDYARIYGLPTVVFRQSCIYGPHQFGVEDQGWIAWFTIAAITGRPLTIYGDGKQVRDVLHVDDLIDLYQLAIERRDLMQGRIYNVGGGPQFTLSLLELVGQLRQLLGTAIAPAFGDWRPGDQRVYVSNIRKAERELGWRPKISPRQGVEGLAKWVQENKHLFN